MSADLAGRVALITGASSGLGRHLAITLCEGRRESRRGRPAAGQTPNTCGPKCALKAGRSSRLTLDVEDEASIIAAYDAAERAFGLVDMVLANAGLNAQGACNRSGYE